MKTTQYVRQECLQGDDIVCRYYPEVHPECQQRMDDESDRILRDIWNKVAPGHLYVVEFAPGHIKVGRTAEPAERLAAHARQARAFGAEVRRSWVSKRHAYSPLTERALIKLCTKHGELIAGREYFALSFETARSFADISVSNIAWDESRLAEIDRWLAESEVAHDRMVATA